MVTHSCAFSPGTISLPAKTIYEIDGGGAARSESKFFVEATI